MTRTLLALQVLTASPALSERLPDGADPATGFRMGHYRAPVPDFLDGGTVVSGSDVQEMMAQRRTIFIDVYPPKGNGPDPLDGSWRIGEKREDIKGSVWLPNVGRGYLEQAYEAYFRRNLVRLTGGDKNRALLFYCTADCWQSWNAARRAITWGYSNVYWFPEGTDGWRDIGGETMEAEPLNFLDGDF